MIDNLINTLESLKISIKVDNGNIKINAPKGTLSSEILTDIKTHKNELIKLLSSSETIPKAKKKECYPLTSSQRRLWTLSQFDEGNVAYNIFDAFQFSGGLDINKLSTAFLSLIERHESLRTIFSEDRTGELGQYIIPVEEYLGELKFLDLSNGFTDKKLKEHLEAFRKHVFDLKKGPLFIGEIVKISNEEHILMLNMHHIIGDGWSMGVLNKEFISIYNSLVSGKAIALQPLSIQYKDYAEWQNSSSKKQELEKSKSFWVDKFKGDVPVLELPTSKIRPKIKTYNGANITYEFSKEITSQLNVYAQQNEVTLFMLLMAGLNGLFSRYSNTGDIILGTPVAGREHTDLENQVGLYLNTLAIRTQFEQESSFKDLIYIQKTTLLEAYSHQEYPFDNLIDDLTITRDISRSALFDVLVVFQNQQELFDSSELSLNGINILPYQYKSTSFSKFDISFIFSEKEGQLSLYLEYNTDVCELSFIERLCAHLDNFLTQGIHHPNQKITTLNYLEASEESLLFCDFNDTTFNIPDRSIVDLFVTQVTKTPESIAVIFEEKEFTYRELDEVSNQLANYLLDQYDLKIEDLVGVKLERNEWLIISLLAVLKTGAAYVPIDPNYPAQRISYIEEDSKCKVTIDENVLRSFSKADTICNALSSVDISSDTLAYVIYTSGSTGAPKGVMITHKNASSMLHWSIREFDNVDFNILYAVTSHCFDLSVYEFFYPLSIGKSIRLLDNGLSIGNYLDVDKKVFINTVPSVLQSLLDKKVSFDNVVGINLAGEAFPMRLAEYFQDTDIQVRNLYGPSEDTTYSSCHLVDGKYTSSVPIGKPIDNTQFYILSEALTIQPIGVTGEICISGDGLSRGYLHKPELTEEKFINHPFIKGKKLYKTGDLGKWQSDGTILFLGRKDNQVKVRGHRIELGEIEHVLEQQEDINQAVVVVKELGEAQVLVAYLVGNLEGKSVLRSILGNQLPEYMIPNYYISLSELPLTPNGKIDKKALPEVNNEDGIQSVYVAPVTQQEKQLVEIWEEILGIDQIGVTDNFFELGGHSLKVALLVNRIKRGLGYSFNVKDVFEHPTILGLLSIVTDDKKSDETVIPKTVSRDGYPLTPSQHRIWVLSQLSDGNKAYNIPGVFEMRGMLDITKIGEAFEFLLDRHESLRTYFKVNAEGEVSQHIIDMDTLSFELGYHNISESKEDVEEKLESIYGHCFDLGVAPLVRLELIKLGIDHHLLVFNLHHIISDGWSMEVLCKEFITVYNCLLEGREITIPALPIQYSDYAVWLQGNENQKKIEVSKAYWLTKFSGELPVLELPTNHPRPKIKTYIGNSVQHHFSSEINKKLRVFSDSEGASLFMVLMAGLNGLFSRYTNQGDIVLGTPIAGRSHSNLENQIGLYLNTLAIRTEFDISSSFKDLLQIQKDTLLEVYTHQEYPFDRLIDQLDLVHDASRSTLFDVMVVLQNQQGLLSNLSDTLGDVSVTQYKDFRRKVSQFDMSFIFSDHSDGLQLTLEYNTDIYSEEIIFRFVSHLENFLEKCIDSPNQSITNINYLNPAEVQELLYDFNATVVDYPSDKTIVDLFMDQVVQTPDATALVYENEVITYRELDEVSNQLANYLLENTEIGKEDLVGVKLERNEWLIVSLLAVLKTGAAYVPIDPNYPEQRISYIEEDSKCKVTIDSDFLTLFKEEVNEFSKELPTIDISSSNLAYIIYTSGSTGKPKGVMIEHKSLSNLCFWHIDYYGLDNTSRGTLYAGVGFDASVWEIYPYLVSGGSLYPIANQEVRYDISKLASFLRDHKITHCYLPTKICEGLHHEGYTLEGVKVLTGGEALQLPNTDDKGLAIYNNYGPSENTVVTTSFDLQDRNSEVLPIGFPISNAQIYILSESLELQPVGVVGELCISGVGLSRGYLHKESLTREKFIAHPFKKGERLYKTGDLARWLANGNIEFLGRKDDQVKIRGYRVELGEIENTLISLDMINQGVVIVDEVQGAPVLIAYYTSDKVVGKQELREQIKNVLPDYMVPSYYVVLDEIPLTPNGKIDKKALPRVESKDLIQRDYVAPITDIEKDLVAIWQEVLGVDQIGVTDNFFELGGHSLNMMVLINKMNNRFNLNLTVSDLYNNTTIIQLERLFKSKKSIVVNRITPVQPSTDGYTVSNEQLRMWIASQTISASKAHNIESIYKITGKFNVSIFKKSIQKLIDRHEALRTYFLTNSNGNVVQFIENYIDVNSVVKYISKEEITAERNINELLESFNDFVFELDKAPLFRVMLIQINEEEHLLSYMMHHIIGDFSSDTILNKELAFIYDQMQMEKSIELPEMKVQYKDYVDWIKGRLNNNEFEGQSKFWRTYLQNIKREIKWHKETEDTDVKGAHFTEKFNKKLFNDINQYCTVNNRGLLSLIATVLGVLIHKTTGQEDVLISVPISLRNHPDLMNQVGLYLNLVPYRVHVNNFNKVDQLLEESSQNQIEIMDSSFYPFDSIIEEFQEHNGYNLVDRIDVCLNIINRSSKNNTQGDFEKLKFEFQESTTIKSKFPICFYIYQDKNQISYTIEYQTKIFEEKDIKTLAKRFCKCLELLLTNSDKEIHKISLIDKKTVPVFGI